ncbi:MAG: hypothetical protein QW666_02035 [Candidatus Woesearchaeota archaeon]
MKKKGFEMQFHWVFILIAGAIILAFFFSLVQKQRALSEEKLSITLATDMEAVFSGAIESKGTAQPLVIPRTGIAFSCSQACECNFVIGKKATEFRDKILFAPSLLSGQNAVAWAQELKMPFRVANFLYLTNPNIKYYLVYEASNQDSLKLYRIISDALPQGLNLESIDSTGKVKGLKAGGFQETKFVFLDITSDVESVLVGLDRSFRKEKVSAVLVQPASKLVSFFEKENSNSLEFSKSLSVFIGEPSIFAAIFSSDSQMYECGMRSAFSRLSHVAQIIYERAQKLQDEMQLQNRTECIYLLDSLESIKESSNQIVSAPLIYEKIQDVNNIVSQEEALERENRNIIQLSCPEIY